jgi:hypothetical protein
MFNRTVKYLDSIDKSRAENFRFERHHVLGMYIVVFGTKISKFLNVFFTNVRCLCFLCIRLAFRSKSALLLRRNTCIYFIIVSC